MAVVTWIQQQDPRKRTPYLFGLSRGAMIAAMAAQKHPERIAGVVLLGFGFALFSSPNTNAVMSSIDRRFYGVGSATLGTMRLTGQMLSMGIAMVIFSLSALLRLAMSLRRSKTA